MSLEEGEKKRKIGILTGGGDCPGLNAVIRAVCRTCSRLGVEVVGLEDGFEGLYEGRTAGLCWERVGELVGEGGTVLGTSNRGHFCGEATPECVWEAVRARWAQLGLEALVCVGGDGTLAIAELCSRHAGIPVVGVPKTIDNDLQATDRTFGFDSAVAVVAESIDRLRTTACSHHRAMVVEVMGRNAGWIALAGALAGGADVCLIPELAWEWSAVVERVSANRKSRRGYSIVVVAEGARLPSGGQVVQGGGQLGGVGARVADGLAALCGVETRLTVLGHTQRGGSPTAFDRVLSCRFGVFAAEMVVARQYGQMASLSGDLIVPVPITSHIATQRLVEPDSQLLHTARMMGIVFGDEQSQC